MKTKSITLFYKVTQDEIFPPAIRELERKENWLKEIQKSVEADWKPQIIKVSYEMFDPEIANQMRFFNGTCVKYYAIQNENLTKGTPDPKLIKRYREEILDEMLGYDLHLVSKTVRRRKSTADFKTVQRWHTFLNTLQETIFDAAGFEFPDSKAFWELVDQHGYDEAERISVEQLQARIIKKNG